MLKVYDTDELAELMKVTSRTIREWIKDPSIGLRGSKIGTKYYFTEEDIRAFLERNKTHSDIQE